eukprot:SAG22_NODE_7691_length_717_cov_0.723301_1_plen_238_part_11
MDLLLGEVGHCAGLSGTSLRVRCSAALAELASAAACAQYPPHTAPVWAQDAELTLQHLAEQRRSSNPSLDRETYCGTVRGLAQALLASERQCWSACVADCEGLAAAAAGAQADETIRRAASFAAARAASSSSSSSCMCSGGFADTDERSEASDDGCSESEADSDVFETLEAELSLAVDEPAGSSGGPGGGDGLHHGQGHAWEGHATGDNLKGLAAAVALGRYGSKGVPVVRVGRFVIS